MDKAGKAVALEAYKKVFASLARFQLGETGEGRIVADLRRRADAWGLPEGYLESLRLFIAEEGRHAAILGTAVRALGGHTLSRTWSADAFGRVRRLAGPGLELLVLLAAEVAALSFYGTLVERLPSGPLREALREIASDEVVHLRFHVDFMRFALPATVARSTIATAWAGLGLAAAAVVIADHGMTLRRLGASRLAVLGRVGCGRRWYWAPVVLRRAADARASVAGTLRPQTAPRCRHRRARREDRPDRSPQRGRRAGRGTTSPDTTLS